MEPRDGLEQALLLGNLGAALVSGSGARHVLEELVMLWQELVQRWVDETDDDRQSVHRFEDPVEVADLETAQRLQR